MKKYNLSAIMKTAHALYNNARAKNPSFAEALKKSWKMAKFNVWLSEQRPIREAKEAAQAVAEAAKREASAKECAINEARRQAQRQADEAKAKAQRLTDEAEAKRQGISYGEYQNRISYAMGYGRGAYCGD